MSVAGPALTCSTRWQRVVTGDDGVAVAERAALGTSARVAVWPPGNIDAACAAADDRDFAAIDQQHGLPSTAPAAAPGWRLVGLDGPLLRLPPGVRLDLGATAKGVGSDRAVRAVMSATGHQGGVLVSLGGDIAVAGIPPRDGWPVTVAEAPDDTGPQRTQLVRLASGAVATSSVTCRRWRRG